MSSGRNRGLGLLLLGFRFVVEKEDKEKQAKTSHELEMSVIKQKTLKIIMESEKKDKSIEENPENSLHRIELVLYLSFFLIFGILASIYILF